MVKEVKTSEPGHRWLHTHLSAAYTLSERGKRFFRQPRIWLLIGKYVADDAHYKKVRNQRWKAQAKGGAPTNPSGMTSVQGGLGKGGGGQVEVEWTMDGKRVWASKWLLLKCTIHKVPMTEAAAAVTEFDVHITDRYARGSVRSGEEALFARLDVASSETIDEVKDDMSEEDWITFDEVVKKAEIEYE